MTLTYPGDWQAFCSEAATMVKQRNAFREAWRRKWGAPKGMWIVEFQGRGAPHLHFYIGLPDAVSDEEYRAMRSRRALGDRLEAEFGKRLGRNKTPPIAGLGEFSDWVLATWSRIVGSGERSHHRTRGVDLRPAFWSDDAEANADKTAIAEYFVRESGKREQKVPTEGFSGFKWWGVWGEKDGFVIAEGESPLERRAYVRARRLLLRLMRNRMAADAKSRGQKPRKFRGPRGMDGLTYYAKQSPVLARRVERWAESY